VTTAGLPSEIACDDSVLSQIDEIKIALSSIVLDYEPVFSTFALGEVITDGENPDAVSFSVGQTLVHQVNPYKPPVLGDVLVKISRVCVGVRDNVIYNQPKLSSSDLRVGDEHRDVLTAELIDRITKETGTIVVDECDCARGVHRDDYAVGCFDERVISLLGFHQGFFCPLALDSIAYCPDK
jgi:hypothetical protein